MSKTIETTILERLDTLTKAVESLRSDFTISQITFFENLPPTAVVGADYVAYRFGCSQSAVVRGRFETDRIPRFRNKPIAFVKRNVDAVWHELNKPVSEIAAKYRHKIGKKKSSS
ncbi:MAG TPA: hypothetical protein PKE69_12880 [Pyrinomonadaceae bacterium]|nr:hypothetical protein [Pyrinomonadaceae bacterium]